MKRSVEERQISGFEILSNFLSGECPPFSEIGVTVNDPNPLQGVVDSMTDCVLGAMDFISPEGYPLNGWIRKALDTIIEPSVIKNFSWGNIQPFLQLSYFSLVVKEKWDNCRNGWMYNFGNFVEEKATACGEAYTKDEVRTVFLATLVALHFTPVSK